MLDFGSTTATSGDRLNSPYHAESGNTTDTTWNRVLIDANPVTGLSFADGTAAAGISYVELKNVGAGSTSVLRGAASGNGYAGNGAMNTGIYAGTSAAGDSLSWNNVSNSGRGVGIQLYGLAEGTYDIYISGRDAAITSTYNMNFYAGAVSKTVTTSNSASTNVNILGPEFLVGTTTFSGTNNTSSWVYNSGDSSASNYVKLSVSITSLNPNLTIFALGDNGAAISEGILSSVQIVSAASPVPEPTSFAFLGGAAGLLFAAGRRRRRLG